jgi:tRNA-specific 2-thiouridylase
MNSQGQKKKVRPEQGRRVFVGLSGGVDSSVAAALLKKAGYEVTGVFIKVWQPPWLGCSWREDRLDAMRVCAKLEIPFVTFDLGKEYKREVVDYMIAEYRAGRTPNPDVMCNKYIKFGGFFDWAMKNGASCVATGHYARIKKLSATSHRLLAGKDKNKDQSYFLWTLTQKQLEKTLFPVGNLTKPEVRKLARKFGLPTAEKKDSQGLCFMGKVNVKDFLSHYIKPKRGIVLSESGEEIGYHNGAAFLTIGERHGFTITKKTAKDKPYFIVAKDVKKNTITVAHRARNGILLTAKREVRIKNVNWISPESVSPSLTSLGTQSQTWGNLSARVRYRQPLQRIEIMNYELGIREGELKVKFEKAQVVAPGQSLVLYRGEECLGGGIIES